MIYGAITNSWRLQLESQGLGELVAQAEAAGARHIELRQTCLGDYESGEGDAWRPDTPGLAALAEDFPGLGFNLAMAFPCLSRRSDPRGEQFQAALEAARAVGRSLPHLRLVDPAGPASEWRSAADIPDEALGVADLASEAARQGVILSMENSGQPVRAMALLVERAAASMDPGDAAFLGLCPDPTNQLRSYPRPDPLDDLEALPRDVIKIVHFKQTRGGQPHPSVADGDLDCRRMSAILAAKGYDGPAVMEIPPSPTVFDNLRASFSYLKSPSPWGEG